MTADIVDLAYPAVMNNEINSAAVILNIEPVADIESLAVDRQTLGVIGSCYHQRYKLLREMIRAIVV